MKFSTTPTMEGNPIVDYRGVVTAEVILGVNIFRDFLAGIRDVVGGRVGSYERELAKGRKMAFEDLEKQAKALGADAVVGVHVGYEGVGKDNMLMVLISGTAVKLSRP